MLVEAIVVSNDGQCVLLAIEGGEKVFTKEDAGEYWDGLTEGAVLSLDANAADSRGPNNRAPVISAQRDQHGLSPGSNKARD